MRDEYIGETSYGNPREKGRIDSLTDRLREEYLDPNRSLSLDDSRAKLNAWQSDYDDLPSHSLLGRPSPREFVTYRQVART